MHKKWLFLLILVALALGMAAPTGQVVADGANHVYFTVTETSMCDDAAFLAGECSFGTPRILNSGKTFVFGYKAKVQFTAEDPRWTAICLFSADPFPPSGPHTVPVIGSWVCTPNDPEHPEYADGWWEGRTSNIYAGDKMVYVWSGKGYGVLDGLLVIHRNTINNTSNEVEIIELPGYQQ